jgi:hypothetical protein
MALAKYLHIQPVVVLHQWGLRSGERPPLPHCGLDWRPDRVYFLTFLNPSRDDRIRPLAPGWPVPATVDEPTKAAPGFTAHAADRVRVPGVDNACARAIQAWQRDWPEGWRSTRQRGEQMTWDQWPGSYLKESWSLVSPRP